MKTKLTKKDIKKYLRNPGKCPFCGSWDIVGNSIEMDGSHTWQEVDCSNCDAAWRDVYALTFMEVVSGPAEEGDDNVFIPKQKVCTKGKSSSIERSKR